MITAIHQPGGLVTSKNPVLIIMNSDYGAEPSHRFRALVTLTSGDRSAIINLIEFPFNSQGKFDLAEILHAFISEGEMIIPELSQTHTTWINVSNGNTCQFTVLISERYGYPLVDGDEDPINVPNANDSTCLMGGFAYDKWPQEKYIADWILQAEQNMPFLTWKPTTVMVSKTQPEYLTIIRIVSSRGTPEAVVIHTEIYYSDGTFYNGILTEINITTYNTYMLAVGYEALGIGLPNPSKKVVYYTIWVKKDNSQITQKRTYYIDENIHLSETYILFSNSLGGFDTVRMFGATEFISDYKKSSTEIANGIYEKSGTRKTIEIEEQAGKKLSTGFISRKEVQWLRDLFLSKNVYIVEEGKLVPIEITTKKLSMPEMNDVNAINIEYDYKFTSNVYTPSYQEVNYIP